MSGIRGIGGIVLFLHIDKDFGVVGAGGHSRITGRVAARGRELPLLAKAARPSSLRVGSTASANGGQPRAAVPTWRFGLAQVLTQA
jgi:hypothetical protein